MLRTGDYAAGFVANGVDGVMVNINNSYSNAIVKSAGENADPLAINVIDFYKLLVS